MFSKVIECGILRDGQSFALLGIRGHICAKVRVLDSFFVVSFVVVISFSHDSTLHFIIYMKNFLSRNLDTNFIFLIHSDIKILLSILEKQNLLVLLQVIMRNFEDNIFVM